MFSKHSFKSCCNNRSTVYTLEKPIKKSHLDSFKQAGFLVPENFAKAGVFYVSKRALIVTGSFGALKLSLRCSGSDCDLKISEFENLLTQVLT